MQLLLEETKSNIPEAVVDVNDPVAFRTIKAIGEAVVGIRTPKKCLTLIIEFLYSQKC